MNRQREFVAGSLAAIVLSGSVALTAQQVPLAPERARSATVRLEMVVTERNGTVSPGSSAILTDLTPGETRTVWGWAYDRPRTANTTRCPTGAAAGNIDQAPWRVMGVETPLQFWSLQLQLVEARVDSVVLRVTIAHNFPDADLKNAFTSEQRTLSLAVQKPYVLGFVDGRQTHLCDWENVLVQLSAEPGLASSTAPGAFGYDVWLVHENARGERSAQAGRASARQEGQAHIDFTPLWWRIPGKPCTVRMDLSADFRGRARENGLIDVLVQPQRTFTIVLADRVAKPNVSGIRGGGQKTLTVEPNELVELVLPDPVEQFQNAPCGVPDTSSRNFVDLGAFFQGSKTSLVLKVRKEP